MKRNIIYDIYVMAHNWLGCIAIVFVYGVLGIPLLKLVQFGGYPEIIGSLVWFGGGIVLGIHIGKAGRIIEAEKQRFERWRDIARCIEELPEKREDAAWKILRSKDLNHYALRDLFDHFQNNGRLLNSILDKYSELNLKTPAQHEERN